MRELPTFQSRQFDRVEVRLLEVRGRGNTGYWLFETTARETLPMRKRPVRFVVKFMPAARKYLRVFSAVPCEQTTAVPQPIAVQFESFVKEEYEKRAGKEYRFTKQGPAFLIQQVADLLLSREIEPEEKTVDELRQMIGAYFTDRADLVARCAKEAAQYWFGDDFTGRFFVTEVLPAQLIEN